MKIKNIVQIIALTGLIATGSAYSMQTMLVNGLKATMRWTGNAMLVGLPLSTSVIDASKLLKEKESLVDQQPDDFRNPTPLEQQFLNRYITAKDAVVKIQKKNAALQSSLCEQTYGKYLVIPETFSLASKTGTTSMTLEDALKEGNLQVLSKCAAIVEHKNSHKKNYHREKTTAYNIVTPFVTTTGTVQYARSRMPYNKAASLSRHFLNMCAKPFVGGALVIGTGLISNRIRRDFEYEADEAVSPYHRTYYEQYVKEQNVSLEKTLAEKTFLLERSQPGSDEAKALHQSCTNLTVEKWTTPPIEKRIELLQLPEPTTLFDHVERKCKKL